MNIPVVVGMNPMSLMMDMRDMTDMKVLVVHLWRSTIMMESEMWTYLRSNVVEEAAVGVVVIEVVEEVGEEEVGEVAAAEVGEGGGLVNEVDTVEILTIHRSNHRQ